MLPTFTAGFALGATALALLDPRNGNRRRHLIRDKTFHYTHAGSHYLGKAGRDLRNRVKGRIAERRSPTADQRVHRPSRSILTNPAPGHVLAAGILSLLAAGVTGILTRLFRTERAFEKLSEEENSLGEKSFTSQLERQTLSAA